MLSTLDKAVRVLYKIVLFALMAIGAVMLVVAWAHVFYRYVLNNSLTWSEELLKMLLVWFCLLSTTIISVQRGHVSIVVFKEKMPKKINHALTFVSQFLMFAASLIVMCIGANNTILAGMRLTPALRIPFRYIYAAIPVAFAILSLYELRNLVADICKGDRLAVEVAEKD